MDHRFWCGKTVLITGHTGFKGSWLSLWLTSMGAKVTGYALEPSQSPNLFNALDMGNDMGSIIADINDFDTLSLTLKQNKPEIVFHLAAQSLVKPSYENPIETFQTNVMGTVNLLEAVRHCDTVKAVVIVTSDKCYENHEKSIPYQENDRLGGFDPYSNSKGCAELVTQSFRQSFFADSTVHVASARAGNVIGGGDWSDYRLIPDVIKAKQTQTRLDVRNPNAIRPWQHVLEPLSGYMTLAQALYLQGEAYAEAWNFGPDASGMKTVEYLLGQVEKRWPDFEWFTQPQQQHHHEAQTLMLDCSKAKQKLNWHAKWSVDEALTETLDWYDAFYSKQPMRKISLEQISCFVQTQPLLDII